MSHQTGIGPGSERRSLRKSRSLGTLYRGGATTPKMKLSSKASSHASRSSTHLSEVLLQHTTRLATAKAKMKYADEEASLIKQEAELTAKKMMLKVKRELDEARCNLEAIYDNMSDDEGDCALSFHGSNVSSPDRDDFASQRTASYVAEQQLLNVNAKPFYMPISPVHTEQPIVNTHSDDIAGASGTTKPWCNPTHLSKGDAVDKHNDLTLCTEFANIFAQKELLTSRLTKFDDSPEFFAAWKISFTNVAKELKLTPTEELDLLIKWLGPSSSEQAKRIRVANANNQERGLQLVWERLHDRFARPENVEAVIKNKIATFPRITNRDYSRLFDLADLASEIESLRDDMHYSALFAYFDSSSGVNQLVAKLPYNIQEKWITEASNYKLHSGVAYPPFSVFCKFIRKMAKVRNDPSFAFDVKGHDTSTNNPVKNYVKESKPVVVRKTGVAEDSVTSTQKSKTCPFHEMMTHTLNSCRLFRSKPLSERKEYIRENGYCFRCCGPKKHLQRKCKETVKCGVCSKSDHPTALHPDTTRADNRPGANHEGEETAIKTACTRVCGDSSSMSKSCAKIIKVMVYPRGEREKMRLMYCMIDEQSTHTLAVSNFFDKFNECGPEYTYTLKSCSGESKSSGRRAQGYIIESLENSQTFVLPEIVECDYIPQNRSEIPVPEVAEHHPHLAEIAAHIQPLDNTIDIELLIGRDLLDVHVILDQRVGNSGEPFAQRIPLGWVVIGNVCLGDVHKQPVVNVNKTSVLPNGRHTYLDPCDSVFHVKDDSIFQRSPEDETIGLSVEDQAFLDIMKSGFKMTEDGKWTAPLPFRANRPILDNNRDMALKRARSFDANLRANPAKATHVVEFMQKIFDNQHAEPALELPHQKECCYLPLFSVYHPKKPDSVRVVFDSSAKFRGLSLNDVLLKGPPSCNSLLGILMRFRKEAVAVTVDVEQMFYNFKVDENHRDYLRFIWHKDNDLSKPLVDHRMTVHVFGNSPSPAVATYGIRKSVEEADQDVQEFIGRNFYVDDGLVSCSSVLEAVDLIQRTQLALQGNGLLRLHKVASNSREVLDGFESEDLAKNLKELDIGTDTLPMQRSLGLLWNTDSDRFTFKTSQEGRPFTRRGILSVINSLFDPLGFAAPVVVTGKLLMRDMMSSMEGNNWDEPLPPHYQDNWLSWVASLSQLEHLSIPRPYNGKSFAQAVSREVHIFL